MIDIITVYFSCAILDNIHFLRNTKLEYKKKNKVLECYVY